MSIASPDAPVVYSTDEGQVAHSSEGIVHIQLDDLAISVSASDLPAMQKKLGRLCDSFRGCDCSRGCRWQLRVPCTQHPVLVLGTDEMRSLNELVQGASTMIELDAMLADASITRS